MKTVTVLGEIDASEMGITLAHEHILIDLRNQYTEPADAELRRLGQRPVTTDTVGEMRSDPYALRDNLLLDDVQCALEEIQRFRDAGGRTIVECTSRGINPQPESLAEISRRTGVNIIAGCGYYTQDTHPADMAHKTVEEIAEEILRDLTEGIAGTGIRAGVIGEIGTSRNILPYEEKVLHAVARVFSKAPRGIYIHTFPWGREGLTASRILIDRGVDPKRIVICHIDVQFDMKYLHDLLETGVVIEFDDFGKEFEPEAPEGGFAGGRFATDAERVQAVKECLEWGFSSQILITTDICLKCMLWKHGGEGYAHILKNVMPMMREAGIDEKTIDGFFVVNPRRTVAF